MASIPQAEISRPFRVPRRWIQLCFAYVAVATLVEGLLAIRHSRSWLISDWLINYQAGFIRRGLPGEVAYYLWHTSHISPVFWVVCFYLGSFAIFLAAFFVLVLRSTRSVWVFAIVISPATLSFHILHPQAGFRKEIIFLAAFAALLVLLQTTKLASTMLIASLTIFMVVGVLSHEALFVYSPYVFAALVGSGRSVKQAISEFSLPLFAGLVTAYVCATHLGNMEMAKGICSSLGYKFIGPDSHDICGSGAIPYLRYSADAARLMSQTLVRHDHYLWIFPGFALLALLPAFGESRSLSRLGLRPEVRIIWISAVASFTMSLILFWYGIDWGRWIYIHTVSISMLLLFIGRKGGARLRTGVGGIGHTSASGKVLAGVFLFAYATLWALPNNIDNTSRMGYVGRVIDRVRHVAPAPPPVSVDPVPVTRQR